MNELKPCPFCGGTPKINARQSKFCGKNYLGNVKLIWTIYVFIHNHSPFGGCGSGIQHFTF